jgi:hypothetical protein
MDYTQFLTDLYRNVYGRDPDPGGFAWNLNLLQTGQVDPSTMAADFSNSAEALQYQASGQRTSEQQAQASQQTLQQDVPQNLQQATQPASPDAPADTTPQGKQFGFNFDINNPQNGAVKTDRNNGQWYFTYADGSTAKYADAGGPWAGQIISVTPPFSQFNDQRLGYRNIPYSGAPNVPDTVQIGGVDVQVDKPELVLDNNGKVYVDPNTKNPVSIASVSPQPSAGGLYNVINSVVAIGASIIASAAFAPVGIAILESATGLTAAELTATYGATSVNSVAAGLSGGGASAVNTALQGGNVNQILESAAKSAVASGVGGTISGSIPTDTSATVAGGATGAARGALSSALAGRDPITGAIKGGVSGAVGGGISDISSIPSTSDMAGDIPLYDPVTGAELTAAQVAAQYPDLYPGGVPSEGSKIASSTGTALTGGLLNYLFPTTKAPSSTTVPGAKSTTSTSAPRSSTTASTTGTPTKTTGSSYILGAPTTSGSTGPGSQALSQVLNLGSPTSAYSDTGATGETLSPETGGKPKNVWNIESLRVKDETGS